MDIEHINSSFTTEKLAVGDGIVPYWSAILGVSTNSSNVKMIAGDHMSSIQSQSSFSHIIENILSN